MPKHLLRTFLALTVCASPAAACARTSAGAPASAPAAKTVTIGFVNGAKTEFHSCLESAIDSAADAYRAPVVKANSLQNAKIEKTNVQSMIAKHVGLLIVQTVDDATLKTDIAEADAARIPIFLTSVDGGDTADILGAVLVDLNRVGQLDASWVANDAAGQGAEAAVIAGAPGAASDLLVKGFTGFLPSNVKVVANQPAMFVRGMAEQVAAKMIKQHPDLRYAFVANEDMAFGAYAAFTAAHKKVKIVTVNGTDEGLQAVKDGKFSATVANSAAQIGQEAVTNALGLLRDPSGEKITNVPITLITKDNVGEAPTYCLSR